MVGACRPPRRDPSRIVSRQYAGRASSSACGDLIASFEPPKPGVPTPDRPCRAARLGTRVRARTFLARLHRRPRPRRNDLGRRRCGGGSGDADAESMKNSVIAPLRHEGSSSRCRAQPAPQVCTTRADSCSFAKHALRSLGPAHQEVVTAGRSPSATPARPGAARDRGVPRAAESSRDADDGTTVRHGPGHAGHGPAVRHGSGACRADDNSHTRCRTDAVVDTGGGGISSSV